MQGCGGAGENFHLCPLAPLPPCSSAIRQGGKHVTAMDFIGVTRTIDQAVYMLLNGLAIVLWRIDSAVIGMSLYSYATQDWLTGNGGGVWYIMDWLLDTSGLFGVNTWTLFAGLALMLWGLARIARPFIPAAPVHPGKLLIFFVLSYVVISQGSALDAGYRAVAAGCRQRHL